MSRKGGCFYFRKKRLILPLFALWFIAALFTFLPGQDNIKLTNETLLIEDASAESLTNEEESLTIPPRVEESHAVPIKPRPKPPMKSIPPPVSWVISFTAEQLENRKYSILSQLPLDRVSTNKPFVIATLSSQNNTPNHRRAQEVLGYSIKKYLERDDVDLMVLYLEGTLTKEDKIALRKAGWDHVLEIPPFWPMRLSMEPRFKPLMAKLWIYALEQFETVLLLDSDMLVTADIGELFYDKKKPAIKLAACRDNGFGEWTSDINAGLLLVHPNTSVFKEMTKAAIDEWNQWNPQNAEQSFLNYYLQSHHCNETSCLQRLPMDYNANYVIWQHYPEIWDGLASKIVHFTTVKPHLMPHSDTEGPIRLWTDLEREMIQEVFPERIT